jgi:hypothetical protein
MLSSDIRELARTRAAGLVSRPFLAAGGACARSLGPLRPRWPLLGTLFLLDGVFVLGHTRFASTFGLSYVFATLEPLMVGAVVIASVLLLILGLLAGERSLADLWASFAGSALVAKGVDLLGGLDRWLAIPEELPLEPGERIRHPYLTIGIVVALTHALLLLNDGLYFEDYVFYDWFPAKMDVFYDHMGRFGNFLPSFYFDAISALPHSLFAFKAVNFTCLLLVSFLTYGLCNASRFLGQGRSVLVAILSVVYPGHMTTAHVNLSFHFVGLLFFMGAAALAVIALHYAGIRSIVLTACAAALFFWSFTVNSFLVYYAGFMLFHAIYARERVGLPIPTSPGRIFARYAPFILTPFAFWAWRTTLGRPHGSGATHTAFELSSSWIWKTYLQFAKLVFDQCIQIFFNPLYFAPCALLAALALRTSKRRLDLSLHERAPLARVAVFALVLLFFATIPYVVVHRQFGYAGTDGDARNRLLLSLPMAVLIVASAGFVCGRRSKLCFILLWAIVGACSINRLRTYVVHEIEAIKDHSVTYQLPRLEGARSTQVFWIRDKSKLERFDFFSSMWLHPANSLSLIFGEFTRFAIVDLDESASTRRLSLEDVRELRRTTSNPHFLPIRFDPDAPQATLVIEWRATSCHEVVVARYYFFKFFRPDQLDPFLGDVVRLTLIPRPPGR